MTGIAYENNRSIICDGNSDVANSNGTHLDYYLLSYCSMIQLQNSMLLDARCGPSQRFPHFFLVDSNSKASTVFRMTFIKDHYNFHHIIYHCYIIFCMPMMKKKKKKQKLIAQFICIYCFVLTPQPQQKPKCPKKKA